MNEFTITYGEIVRELVTDIEIESALNPVERVKIKAIWDTGSFYTIITPETAKKLNLKCVSLTTISSITDKNKLSKMYMAHLYLPNEIKCETFVYEANPINCDILIGMDIITRGKFIIDNNENRTVFSFRIPENKGERK